MDALSVLTDRYEERQGHAPGERAGYVLACQAADQTRPPKRTEMLSLAELRTRWRAEKTQMSIGKIMAVSAAAFAACTALVLAPTSATAETSDATGILSCTHQWSNPDDTGEKTITRNAVNIRSGPHAAAGSACSVVGTLNTNDKVFYHCYTTTQNEGTWTHLRKSGTTLNGWVKDTLLPGNGSNYPC